MFSLDNVANHLSIEDRDITLLLEKIAYRPLILYREITLSLENVSKHIRIFEKFVHHFRFYQETKFTLLTIMFRLTVLIGKKTMEITVKRLEREIWSKEELDLLERHIINKHPDVTPPVVKHSKERRTVD